MKCEHGFGGETIAFYAGYDVEGSLKSESKIVVHFIPHAYFLAIPAPTSVSKVKHLFKIDIEVRFAHYAVIPVVVEIPDLPVIVLRARAAVHADRVDRNNFSQFVQVFLKQLDSAVRVPFGKIHILVVIADFVPHFGNLPNYTFVKALGYHAEVVGPDDSELVLYPGKLERMLLAVVHIVPQYDSSV